MDLKDIERQEIFYWKDSAHESPREFTLLNLVNKMSEARVFLEKVKEYREMWEGSSVILELGGGQGWASCILKRLFPNKLVYCSDISPYALGSLPYWEEIFKVKLDGAFACRSYEIPLKPQSVDLVFCFQSAHHFREHKRTLGEVYRVLGSQGCCLFLYEPSCRRFFYGWAYKRVNAKRPSVPEDVLIYKEMESLASELGFAKGKVRFAPSLTNRGPLEVVYYYILGKIPFLQRVLPCSADYLFCK